MKTIDKLVAVVSHDAGGAEILSSYLLQNPHQCCFVLEGPSIAIFKRKLGICQASSLADAIQISDWVLCGTSWQSNLEKQAILEARNAGKKVVAFLDHWVNYRERFEFNGINVIPDEIWVGDEYGQRLANQIFPTIPIILVDNPYLKEISKELNVIKKKLKNSNHVSILYLCEPILEHALTSYGDERYFGYSEQEALLFFIKHIPAITKHPVEIVIRPHPSECIGKYGWIHKTNSNLSIKINSDCSLIENIALADVVVGCETMAMVLALLAGKRVISSIPVVGKICSLPYSGIEDLRQLVLEKY